MLWIDKLIRVWFVRISVYLAGNVKKANYNSGDESWRKEFKGKLKEKVVVLLASVEEQESKVQLILSVTEDLSKQYPANKLIKDVAREVGGGGGGRRDMAQAGGKKPESLDDAFKKLHELIKG